LRCLLLAFVGLSAFLPGVCQEKLVLDAATNPPVSSRPIVSGHASAGFAGGVIDGPQPPPRVVLTLQQLTPTASTSDKKIAIRYELRLTNTSPKPISLPVNPDRDRVIALCGTSPLIETALGVGVKETPPTTTPGQWQDYYGCDHVAATVVVLKPGEWITYRGTVALPAATPRTALLEGNWLFSNARYTDTANGLTEDSELILSATSTDRKLESLMTLH